MRFALYKLICLFVAVMLIAMPSSLQAGPTAKILIINSDHSVEKYQLAQDEYVAHLDGEKIFLDLGRGDDNSSLVEETILDESPDLIYCIGFRSYVLAHRFSDRDTPIVFSSIINWQRMELTGNVYGVSNELYSGMQLMMFRYFFPKVEKVGILYSNYNKEWLNNTLKEAEQVNVSIISKKIKNSSDINPALIGLQDQVDAIWLISDPVVLSSKKSVTDFFKSSDRYKIPVFSYSKAFSKFSPAFIVETDISTIARQAAQLSMDLLNNKTPEKQVLRAVGTYSAINLKRVNEYGVFLNKSALGSLNDIHK